MIFPAENHGFLMWKTWIKAYGATADFFDRTLKRRQRANLTSTMRAVVPSRDGLEDDRLKDHSIWSKFDEVPGSGAAKRFGVALTYQLS